MSTDRPHASAGEAPTGASPTGLPRQMKLSDRLYEQILALIINGEFPENSKLPTEIELSDRFGVSRPVVREALARLRDDDLIHSRQGAGSFVLRRPDKAVLRLAPMGSIADIQRCFEYRVALEGEAAFLAAQRHDAEGLAAIEKALRDLDEVIATGKLGVDADLAFHLAVADATTNHFFQATLHSIQSHIGFGMNLARSLSLNLPEERLHQVQSEHNAVFRAIRDRDAVGARAAMRTHLENARRRVFEGQAS